MRCRSPAAPAEVVAAAEPAALLPHQRVRRHSSNSSMKDCLLGILFVVSVALVQGPTPQQLAQEAITNGRRLAAEAPEYTADYRSFWRTYSKTGRLENETVITGETYQSSVRNVDIELTRNGKAIKDKDIQKRREAAGRELQKDYEQRMQRKAEAREKGSSTVEGTEYSTLLNNVRMDYYAILREFDLRNLRHEMRQGRDTFVLDFQPRDGYQPSRKDFSHLPSIRGSIWIDAADRVVVEWRASIAKGPNAGHVFFEQDFERLPDGTWAGRRLRLNQAAAPELLGGRIEWINETSNRRRFGVAVEERIQQR